MGYKEFFLDYGASCRSKWLAKRESKGRTLKNRLRLAFGYPPREDTSNRVPFDLPVKSRLPAEFIRLDPWEMEYLYMLAALCRHGILETGRFRGGSTFLLAHANPSVPIWSIDIDPVDDAALRCYFNDNCFGSNVELIVGDSQKTRYDVIGEISLLFIDGDHSYEGCSNDMENWYPEVVTGGHIVLHDSYFGCEVQSAIIDFIARHEVEIIQTPYISASHWRFPCGSLAHFRKIA